MHQNGTLFFNSLSLSLSLSQTESTTERYYIGMSDPNESLRTGSDKNAKRNLPSWMSSRANDNKSEKGPIASGDVGSNSSKAPKQSQESDLQQKDNIRKSLPTSSGASKSSMLLEGVVFVLSGFVNPKRSVLRSQALEMGAEYQADWNSDCTLLICAFPNTPKFRQVEADCGTIVSEEWISECHSQKKLVDIDSYLMHAGKPWRKQNTSTEASQVADPQSPSLNTSQKKIVRESHAKSTSKKSEVSNPAKFAHSRVKNWAVDDFNKTISWLESQEEKPEASEIKKIAAEGILTCLQDAIDSLKAGKDIQQIIEQWSFIPRAVEELAKLDGTANSKSLLSKEELCKEATMCKEIYEAQLSTLNEDSLDNKRPRTNSAKKSDSDYDSDETIEMTEEEIDLAFDNVASKLTKH